MRHLLSFAVACASCLPGAHAETPPSKAISKAAVIKAIAARLPRTTVTHVDCTILPALCEVQAGSTLFYVDPKARFLVVGHVYDLEKHQDLTATRLLAINPDSMVAAPTAAHISDDGLARKADAAVAPPTPGTSAATQKVSLAELPASGSIVWGGTGPHVTIFSDFHCGYCRMFHHALKEMGAQVSERPISVLGTRSISEAVLCAPDRGTALDKAYDGETPAKRACDVSGLDANEAFASAHGFSGTPVLVRDDGAVVLGYRPREFLEAWLKGGA